jgi:hypothetical protein
VSNISATLASDLLLDADARSNNIANIPIKRFVDEFEIHG